VGTERGNIYMVHVETFKVSGYVISWSLVCFVFSATIHDNFYFPDSPLMKK